jgi:Alpha/beta hydrolase domain
MSLSLEFLTTKRSRRGELLSTNGSISVFPRAKAEREKNGDPRLSVQERYPSHEAYVETVKRAVDGLVKEGLMLPEDGERYIEAARKKNPLDSSVPLEPLVTAGRED